MDISGRVPSGAAKADAILLRKKRVQRQLSNNARELFKQIESAGSKNEGIAEPESMLSSQELNDLFNSLGFANMRVTHFTGRVNHVCQQAKVLMKQFPMIGMTQAQALEQLMRNLVRTKAMIAQNVKKQNTSWDFSHKRLGDSDVKYIAMVIRDSTTVTALNLSCAHVRVMWAWYR